tara:strand:+ start:243 stop:557 length:315 start_codon:yes stop_codon:yes gene_type:complete
MKKKKFVFLIVLPIFSLIAYSSIILFAYISKTQDNAETINEETNQFPAGMSSACICADALNGTLSYNQTQKQIQQCRKMFICVENATTDCMLGISSVWTKCERF